MIRALKEDRNITLTRAISCIMIVLVHAGELKYYDFELETGIFELSAISIIIGRVAVPLFFMISGFLLFSKNKIQHFSFNIIKKRFLSIFIPLLFFTIVYYFYNILLGNGFNPFNNESFGHSISHLWYLGYILPVYTFSPFIHIPHLENNKQLWGLLGIVTAFFFLTESIMSKPYTFEASYSFNQALLYMFVGYILKQFHFVGKKCSFLFLGIFILLIQISFLLVLYEQNFVFSANYGGNEYFNHILKVTQFFLGGQESILGSYKTLAVYLQAISLFLFFQSLNLENLNSRIYNPISYIAKKSLKIYGWHMLFILLVSSLTTNWNPYTVYCISVFVAILGPIVCAEFEIRVTKMINLQIT